MKRSNLIILIVSLSLIIAGITISALSLMLMEFDISKFANSNITDNTYPFEGEITDISVMATDVDVYVISSAESGKVVSSLPERVGLSVYVEDGKLVVKEIDGRKWYDYIMTIHLESPSLTVHLPAEQYETLSVATSSGRIEVDCDAAFDTVSLSASSGGVSFKGEAGGPLAVSSSSGKVSIQDAKAQNISVSSSSGSIKLSSVNVKGDIKFDTSSGGISLQSVKAKSLAGESSSGKIKLDSVILSGAFRVISSSGRVELTSCDAESLYIRTSSGSVVCKLLSPKRVIAASSSGSVNVPRDTDGGRCEIVTGSGSINVIYKD